MDTLKLKHLAPYLPYKLRIQYQERNQVMNMGQGHSTHWIGIKSVLNWQDVNGEPPKPILRPLSYLKNKIEINGVKFIPVNELSLVDGDLEIYTADENGNEIEYIDAEIVFEDYKKLLNGILTYSAS